MIFLEINIFLKIEKNGLNNDGVKYIIRVYFENNPMILRKIELSINDDFLQISVFNHNYNEDFDENFFKLISPKLLN